MASDRFEPLTAEIKVDDVVTQWYLARLMTPKIDAQWVLEQKNSGVFSQTAFTDFSPEELKPYGFVNSLIELDEKIPCVLE